jgi:hypothetical protein
MILVTWGLLLFVCFVTGKDEGETERVWKGIAEERGVETARGIHVVFLSFPFLSFLVFFLVAEKRVESERK